MSNVIIWGITDYLIEHKLEIDWSYISAVVYTDNSKDDSLYGCPKITVNMLNSVNYQYLLLMDEDDCRYHEYADENHIISKECSSRLSFILPDAVFAPVYNFVNSNIYAMGARSVLDVDNGTIKHGYIMPNIYWPNYKLVCKSSKELFPFYKNNLYDSDEQIECALFLDPFENYDINEFIKILKENYSKYPYVAFNLPMEMNYPKYMRDWRAFPFQELGLVYIVDNADCGAFCMWEPSQEHRKKVHMHVISHKPFELLAKESCYSKLFVGNICEEILDSENKETVGDNISTLNPYINENTGIYWAWKNDNEYDYIGFCHYRRYFTSDDVTMAERHILTQSEIERYLDNYDIIVSGSNIDWRHNIENSLKESINENAFDEAIKNVKEAIEVAQPEYIQAFEHVFSGYTFFPCNMFIMPKGIFDKYCQWLFSILPKACEGFCIEKYDNYSSRAVGFIAERMLTVWLMKQSYRVKELPIQQVEV